MVHWNAQIHKTANSIFALVIWSSGQDLVISLYLKVPEKFMLLILFDKSLFVHIPFDNMIKFQFLAQFLVDHLPTRCRSWIYTPFVVVCYVRLSCDLPFRLCHHITFTCYSVVSYRFSLEHNLSFVLLFEVPYHYF